MSRFAALLVAAASLLTSSCGDDDITRNWTDLSEFGGPAVGNATELLATTDYRLLLGDSPSNYGPEASDCIQLVVGTVGLLCIEVGLPAGSSTGGSVNVRFDDLRLIWRADTTPDDSDSMTDHFVVWSSVDPDGRRIEPVEEAGVTNLIWKMQPGEAPWGIQALAADGSLLESESLAGLPEK